MSVLGQKPTVYFHENWFFWSNQNRVPVGRGSDAKSHLSLWSLRRAVIQTTAYQEPQGLNKDALHWQTVSIKNDRVNKNVRANSRRLSASTTITAPDTEQLAVFLAVGKVVEGIEDIPAQYRFLMFSLLLLENLHFSPCPSPLWQWRRRYCNPRILFFTFFFHFLFVLFFFFPLLPLTSFFYFSIFFFSSSLFFFFPFPFLFFLFLFSFFWFFCLVFFKFFFFLFLFLFPFLLRLLSFSFPV